MQIVVNCSHFDSKANEVLDYQNHLDVDDSLVVDFRTLYQSLRLLYPRATFVTFKLA